MLEVLSGIPVIEVAERYGVARQTVHRWMARYRTDGIAGLADRSHAPKQHPSRERRDRGSGLRAAGEVECGRADDEIRARVTSSFAAWDDSPERSFGGTG